MEDQSIKKPQTKFKPLFESIETGFWPSIVMLFTPFASVPKVKRQIIQYALLLTGLLLWTFEKSTLFPSLIEIFEGGLYLFKNQALGFNIVTSFILCVISMAIATALSAVISYASTIPIFRPICLFIAKGRFLSLVGLLFFFTILLPGGFWLKVGLLVFSVTVFFVDSYISVINSIDTSEFYLAKVLRMGPWETLYRIVIKGKLADLIIVSRQTFAMAWMSLTMVETLVKSGGGIGVLLTQNDKLMQLGPVFAIIFLLIFIGKGVDWVFTKMLDLFCPYYKLSQIKSE